MKSPPNKGGLSQETLSVVANQSAEIARSAVLAGTPPPVAQLLAKAHADRFSTAVMCAKSVVGEAGGRELFFNALKKEGVSPPETMFSPRAAPSANRPDDGRWEADRGSTGRESGRSFARGKIENGASSAIVATPYVWTDPDLIPQRQWLYARSFARGYVTVTVAPGGVGKSSLSLVEALALITGRPLLGKKVETPLRVWIWNLEDPLDELQRRIQAICEHFDISAADISDRLYVDSGRIQGLCIAETSNRGKTTIMRPVVDALIAELQHRQIDLLIVDPFVSSHAVPENDNPSMDKVAKEWGKIADATNCAVHLIHHTRKLGSDSEVTAESSRGGKALTDAARVVRAINRMSPEEATNFGVSNHRSFFKVFDDKSNMAPPPDISDWYQQVNVILPNGDHVGVVERWFPPDSFAGVSVEHLRQVQNRVAKGDYRENVQASDWVGSLVADVLSIDATSPSGRHRLKRLIAKWIENGALKLERATDDKRRERTLDLPGKSG
ncbi:AAA family ATPase, partial [Rhizobium sp.]|uniref:AAA family ATPase n=1 Tax=Rhizobium sp. TaxID=391 RepID=UPI002AA7545D